MYVYVCFGFILFLVFTFWVVYERHLMIQWIGNHWYLSSTDSQRDMVSFLKFLKHHPEMVIEEIEGDFKKLLLSYIKKEKKFLLLILVFDDKRTSAEEIVSYLTNSLLPEKLAKIEPAPE